MSASTDQTEAGPAGAPPGYVPRLKRRYREEIRPALMEQFGISNVMEVASLQKVVVNVGLGEAVNDAKAIEGAVDDLSTITGQKPRINRARKSIAGFKLRQGMPIGAMVTLRGDRMWEFTDRVLSVVLPRIRDFRGLNPRSFDGNGNYTLGVDEQLVFPEVEYDEITGVRGMDITFVTTADDDERGYALLRELGLPFAREE